MCLCLLLAGCSSIPHDEQSRARDWNLHQESKETSPDVAAAQQPVFTENLTQPPTFTNVPPPETQAPPEVAQPAPVPSTPPAKAPPQPIESYVSLVRWCREQGLAPPVRIQIENGTVITMGKEQNTVRLMPFSSHARWRGMDVQLGQPVKAVNDDLFVHSLDLRKTLLPLVAPERRVGPPPRRSIVIDPGHGGLDGGARSGAGALEKELTLDWAQRIGRLLSASGWQVFLTRTNDTDLALSNRVTMAEYTAASAFISLHFNSAGKNSPQSGVETYCLTPSGLKSGLTRGYADDTAAAFANNVWDDENLLLACVVHGELTRLPRAQDRGVRRARFLGILRGQQRPAILIEGGYLSNTAEARQLSDARYRQSLAAAVARGVNKWFGPGPGEVASASVAPSLNRPAEHAPAMPAQQRDRATASRRSPRS